MIEMREIKPVGQFLIDSGKGQQCSLGMFYSYSDVCVLLTQYAKLKREDVATELADARAEIERLNAECDWWVARLREKEKGFAITLSRQTELIEELREALNKIKAEIRSAHRKADTALVVKIEGVLMGVDAALDAAERGK